MSLPLWKLSVLEERLKRGPHKSHNDSLKLLREEMLGFVKRGFWAVLPCSQLKEKLKLSSACDACEACDCHLWASHPSKSAGPI